MEATAMAGRFLIKITKDRWSEFRDLRYRYIWSAWLDGALLGKGHAFRPEEAIERAHDLVTPDQVEHVEIREAWAARGSRAMSQGTDRDRLYQQYVASTDQEFAYAAELKQAADETAAALQTKLEAQSEESRRLWLLYRTSEPND